MKDPLYRNILEGLAAPLDRELFEECVAGLLREEYPRLVPIPGGGDAGMDGAIADGEGEAYPLIVSTDKQPIRNLTRSLESYCGECGDRARNRVVFVTSQGLSATRRRNLEARAREKGFTLVQIYERCSLAQRLYRDPQWRKELLGIPGPPPALSAFPQTHRPQLDLEPVGRDADLEWLRTTKGDRLLYGEPGSGKTFLLMQLVRAGEALFLASDDWEAVTDAYREQRPEIVLVDDAHVALESLERLRQIRTDTGAKFDLVATCWRGEEEQVSLSLGDLGSNHLRRLELLTRREILEVYRLAGVDAPSAILGELVDQAANKPGLAVTLATLWLRREWQDVLSGHAVRKRQLGPLQQVLGGKDPTALLAAFSLGGDRGMKLSDVAEALDLSREDVWERATRIAAGGVLKPRDGNPKRTLSVEPRVLRYALLGEVCFSDFPAPFDYQDLLDKAPSPERALENLVAAAGRSVPIPRELLESLLLESESVEAWGRYARLGEAEAQWVVEKYPWSFSRVAEDTIQSAPRATLQRLFQAAAKTVYPVTWSTNSIWRLLTQWLQEIPPADVASAPGESLRRRRLLMQEAKVYGEAGGEPSIVQRAVLDCFSPNLYGSEPTPLRDGARLRWGLLPPTVLEELEELWDSARSLIHTLDPSTWTQINALIRDWTTPRITRKLAEEEADRMRRFAEKIVRNIAPEAAGSLGYSAGLHRMVTRLGLDCRPDLDVDPEFDVLFPDSRGGTEPYRDRLAGELEAARELAERWLSQDVQPGPAIEKLAYYCLEAEMIQATPSLAAAEFCWIIADQVDPVRWLSAAIRQELPLWLVHPFLQKVAERGGEGEAQLLQSLSQGEYQGSTIEVMLQMADPPLCILDAVSDKLAENPQAVEEACQGGKVPLSTLRRLLEHPEPPVAVAAAVGEWLAEPTGEVRQEIRSEWRSAILRATSREYKDPHSQRYEFWLGGILQSDPSLALDWLRTRFQDPDLPDWVAQEGPFTLAGAALDEPQKTQILVDLEELTTNSQRPRRPNFVALFVRSLVDSPATYELLLGRPRLRHFHLAPLEGLTTTGTGDWKVLAKLALDAGHNPEEVVENLCFLQDWIGHGVEHWTRWETTFSELETSTDRALRDLAHQGLHFVRSRLATARQKERQAAMTGW